MRKEAAALHEQSRRRWEQQNPSWIGLRGYQNRARRDLRGPRVRYHIGLSSHNAWTASGAAPHFSFERIHGLSGTIGVAQVHTSARLEAIIGRRRQRVARKLFLS